MAATQLEQVESAGMRAELGRDPQAQVGERHDALAEGQVERLREGRTHGFASLRRKEAALASTPIACCKCARKRAAVRALA